jgi:dihydropyrimidinase
MIDTVIKNCIVVSPRDTRDVGIGIDKGIIVTIDSDDKLPLAKQSIDAEGKHVLPGIIDVHVHCGLYHLYDEEIADMTAAAYGGTTTIGCYVSLGVSSGKGPFAETFENRKSVWESNSVIDAFFHGGMLTESNADEIMDNARKYGVTSYKFMLTRKGSEVAAKGGQTTDDGFLWANFSNIAKLGKSGLAICHAENIEVISRVMPKVQQTGRQELAAWAEARPGFCETLDVIRASSIAKVAGCRIYFVHQHYPDSIKAINRAKAEGIDVTAETCPQYLVLNADSDIPAPYGRINPPLRDKESNEGLWQAISDGSITCLGSDHCSTTKDPSQDLWTASSGMPGVETFFPIMLSEGVSKGRIALEKLVELLCYNNAKTFGIYPQKGTISVGSDADLVVVDLDKKVNLSQADSHYSVSNYCPYEGWEVQGWPVLTMLRGNVIVKDGELVAKPGTGRYIPRSIE